MRCVSIINTDDNGFDGLVSRTIESQHLADIMQRTYRGHHLLRVYRDRSIPNTGVVRLGIPRSPRWTAIPRRVRVHRMADQSTALSQ